MSDYSYKNIENITIGDEIITINLGENKNEIIKSKVLNIFKFTPKPH